MTSGPCFQCTRTFHSRPKRCVDITMMKSVQLDKGTTQRCERCRLTSEHYYMIMPPRFVKASIFVSCIKFRSGHPRMTDMKKSKIGDLINGYS
jgi:hypothetical protein